MTQINHLKNLILTHLFAPAMILSVAALIVVRWFYFYFNISLQPSLTTLSVFININVLFFCYICLHYIWLKWVVRKNTRLFTHISELFRWLSITVPFFIFLYAYDSIHGITHLINNYEWDWLLIKIDRFILMGYDIYYIFEQITTPTLTSYFAFSYKLYFVFFIINPIIYFFMKNKSIVHIALTTVIIGCYIGLVGYVAVPCVGPILTQNDLFSKELILLNGNNYQTEENLINAYLKNRGYFHCFPSLHVGISFIWLYLAWKYMRKHIYLKYVFYLHIPLVASLWLSTLYLRWHYLIDWAGGFMVAIPAIWLAPKIYQLTQKILKKYLK